MLGLGFIAPLLPIYATSLGASGFEIGVIFAAFAVVRAATMIPFGSLSDIFGRKFFIVLGMGVYVLASITYVLSKTVLQLIFCRILHGIASALVVPAAMAYVADVSPEDRRGEAMGLFNTALFAGIG
ncbi:MFS transporter, partial [Candidatus Bathyarchaeota archaeon]